MKARGVSLACCQKTGRLLAEAGHTLGWGGNLAPPPLHPKTWSQLLVFPSKPQTKQTYP